MNIDEKKNYFIHNYMDSKHQYESEYEKTIFNIIDTMKNDNWKKDDEAFITNIMLGVPEVIEHLGLKEKVDKYMEETKERRHAFFEKQYLMMSISDDMKYLKEKWYDIIGDLK